MILFLFILFTLKELLLYIYIIIMNVQNNNNMQIQDNKNVSIDNMTTDILNKDKMIFTENIDLDRCEDFCGLDFQTYYKLFIKGTDDDIDSDDKMESHKKYFEYLKKNFNRKIKFNNSTYDIEYKYGKSNTNGRLYAETFGIQILPCRVKEYIIKDIYYDYDIVNAAPSILLYLCDTIGFKSTFLKNYVKNRNKKLEKHKITKLDVIIMINSEICYSKNTYLKNFHKEIKKMKPLINDKYKHLISSTFDNLKNLQSKIMSRIIFYFESKILQKVIKKNIDNVGVPYFDGFLSDKKLNVNDLNELTKEFKYIKWILKPFKSDITLKENIITNTQFNISHLLNLCDNVKLEFIKKKYKLLDIDIFDGSNDKKKDYTKKYKNLYYTELNEALDYFNKYTYVINQNEVSYTTDVYNKNGIHTKTINHKNFMHFNEYYCKFKIINLKDIKKNICELWKDYKFRREYYEVVFRPNIYYRYRFNESNVLNLWKGWVYDYDPNYKLDMECIKNIIYHLKEIVCNNNEECYNYLLKQWKVILLGKKSNIALGLTGSHGVGKNIITEYFGTQIIGKKYYSYVSNIDTLLGQFTSMKSEKVFIVCDELDHWSGSKKDSNKLKSIITSILSKKELKGKDAYNIESYCNYAFLSNFNQFLRLEGKTDRRYYVLKVSSKKQGDTKYFKKLNLDMGNTPKTSVLTKKQKKYADYVGENFFHFIMGQNLDNFDLEKIPLTDQRKGMIIESTPTIDRYYMWILINYKEGHMKFNTNYKLEDLYFKFIKGQIILKYITSCKGKISFSKMFNGILDLNYLGEKVYKRSSSSMVLNINKKYKDGVEKAIKKLNRKYIFNDEIYEIKYDDINDDDNYSSRSHPDIESDF